MPAYLHGVRSLVDPMLVQLAALAPIKQIVDGNSLRQPLYQHFVQADSHYAWPK